MQVVPTQKLDGWKAIAHYLGRDERTAQRWARERTMPVHRVPGGRGATVFAFREELDDWLRQPVVIAGDTLVATDHPVDTVPTPPAPVSPAPAVRTTPTSRAFTWSWMGMVTALLLAIGTVSLILMKGEGPPAVAAVDVEETTLRARDAKGGSLWTYRLAAPPDASGQPGLTMHPELRTESAFVDLDSDGHAEVLVFVSWFAQRPSLHQSRGHNASDEVVCLTSRGERLWSVRPEGVWTFAGRRFDSPWLYRAWGGSDSSARQVWLAFIHHTWWPSFLVTIDANGTQAVRYVSSGHVYALAQLRTETGSVILAAGVNNEYAAASLAVLNEDAPPATSPQSSALEYWCDNCPPGRPRRYYVFPRSELNHGVLADPYNRADQITVGTSHFEVSVYEGFDRIRTIYRLSRSLDVESVAMSDRYWETHRRLEREGKLTHTVEQCEGYTKGNEVRVWSPETGWTTTWARQERKAPPQ